MSQNQLKIIALVTMVFDHIGAFIPNAPIWFCYIGRISAPIFMFCSIQAYIHTKDKMKYIFRLGVAAVVMTIGNSLLYLWFYIHSISCYPIENNFFATLYIGTIIVYIYDNCKSKVEFLIIVILWQVAVTVGTDLLDINVLSNFKHFNGTIYDLLNTVLGVMIRCEGGPLIVLLYLLMYLPVINKNKNMLGLVYFGFVMLLQLTLLKFYNRQGIMFWSLLPFVKYQGLMILALPVFYWYNGLRGSRIKAFYYIFYPLHIWVLYSIGVFIKI